MKLVTRYVVREHVGPLLFALSALTSLLMLQYVARQLANLAGKGLPWKAIAQFFVLSLPFTIAMTLPMAVLVATLYAFGRMAAEHEITAFKASGVRVRTLMLPVVGCAFLLSLAMVAFNDQVLPRANHQLRMLQTDIARTKPTLALRDQVLIAITDQFYMRVARSNAATNMMWGIDIYDLTRGPDRQTVYADSGLFLLAPNKKDLQLVLFDGHSQQFVKGDPRRFQRDFFRQQVVQVRGISQAFETSRGDTYRGDREMSICEMQRKYRISAMEYGRIRKDYLEYSGRMKTAGQQTYGIPRGRPAREVLAELYCVTIPSLFQVKTAQVQQPPVQQPPVQPATTPVPQNKPSVAPPGTPPGAQRPDSGFFMPQNKSVPLPPPSSEGTLIIPRNTSVPIPAAAIAPPTDASPAASELNTGSMLAATQQLLDSRESLDSLAVEIHKKFALSFACLVFVLFGPPIALRFPRGGVGVTLGVSIVVFGLYYICLMAGEALADKGKLPAFVAMWIANATFTVAGLVLLWRVESTVDSSRGGGLREWWSDRAVRRALAAQMASERKARA